MTQATFTIFTPDMHHGRGKNPITADLDLHLQGHDLDFQVAVMNDFRTGPEFRILALKLAFKMLQNLVRSSQICIFW